MRKKPPQPPLTIVGSSIANPLAPPATLGKTGAELWRTIMSEYAIEDGGGRQILLQSCAAADRAAECASLIARDGLTVRSPHGPKDHPLLKHELAARAFVVRSLHKLGLDIEPVREPGRPSARHEGLVSHAHQPPRVASPAQVSDHPGSYRGVAGVRRTRFGVRAGARLLGGPSPLPAEITASGVSPDLPPYPNSCRMYATSRTTRCWQSSASSCRSRAGRIVVQPMSATWPRPKRTVIITPCLSATRTPDTKAPEWILHRYGIG